jgi:hypothetical protein
LTREVVARALVVRESVLLGLGAAGRRALLAEVALRTPIEDLARLATVEDTALLPPPRAFIVLPLLVVRAMRVALVEI